MIRIDSIKIRGPEVVVNDIDINRFQHVETTDTEDRLIKDNYTIDKKSIAVSGLNSILFNAKNNTIQIALSSKILGNDYYDLINQNNIEKVFDTINNTGIVNINKSELNKFVIDTVDFTTNVKGNYTPNEFINTMQLMSINSKYNIDVFKGCSGEDKHKTGIVFRGQQKSFNERCIMYAKEVEIIKDQEFMKSIKNPLIFLNEFKNVLRVESNMREHRKIREYTNTGNTLISVLESSAINPNYKLFQKIKSQSGWQTNLFDYSEDTPLKVIEKLRGRQGIIEDLNYDFILIKEFLKKHFSEKSNISRYIAEYKKVANQLLKEKKPDINQDKIIIELENLLQTG